MVGVALLVSVVLRALEPEASAAQLEAQAFVAIEEQRWCDAMHGFVAANALSPSEDLTMNAAMAADYGQDRVAAVSYYSAVVAQKGPRAAEAKKRLAFVKGMLAKQGPGQVCQAPVAPAPAPTPAPLPTTTTSPAPTKPAPAAVNSARPFWPLALSIGGGVVAVASGGAIAFGLQPYGAHSEARAALDQAQKRQEGDADVLKQLQREQTSARTDWEVWGLPLVIGGASVLTASVLVVAAGLGLWVALPDEANPPS